MDGLRRALADYRGAIHYVRTTPDGRLAFRSAGCSRTWPGTSTRASRTTSASIRVASRPASDVPDLRRRPVEAVGADRSTSAGSTSPSSGPGSGTVHYGLGYTGNGVGPAHLGGRILANRALGRHDAVLKLPLVDDEPRRFPPEPIRSPGAMIANHAIQRRGSRLTRARRRTRSRTSSRSCRGGWATTSARSRHQEPRSQTASRPPVTIAAASESNGAPAGTGPTERATRTHAPRHRMPAISSGSPIEKIRARPP